MQALPCKLLTTSLETFGSHIEIQAAARIFQRDIRVIMSTVRDIHRETVNALADLVRLPSLSLGKARVREEYQEGNIISKTRTSLVPEIPDPEDMTTQRAWHLWLDLGGRCSG